MLRGPVCDQGACSIGDSLLLNADVMTERHGVPMDDWPNLWTARSP